MKLNLRLQFGNSKEKGTVKMNDKEKMEVAVIENEQVNKVEINEETIKNLIYVVRGKQVMLDSDLAMLYQVETGNLNKAMKRNINRFPEDFCFQLVKDEFETLIFQNGISNENARGGRRKLPYVYTEQGISMLSAVLRSEVAIKVSVKIMRTFVEMRRYLGRDIFLLEYHIGASLKDAGKKCFAINKIEDKVIVADILNRLSLQGGGE